MRGKAHAIYWRLHTAYLRNYQETAEKFLGMLEDECKSISLENEIGKIHYERFLLISHNIKHKLYIPLWNGGTAENFKPMSFQEGEPIGEEKEFHKLLLADRLLLYDVIGASKTSSIMHEIDVNPYGRIDFIVKDGRIWYVVEVKMGEVGHHVTSQIAQYRIAMEMTMNLGLHDIVKAAVVAPAFNTFAQGELTRNGVLLIGHSGTPESLCRLK